MLNALRDHIQDMMKCLLVLSICILIMIEIKAQPSGQNKKAVHSSSKTLIKKMTTITPTTTPPPNTKPDKKNMTMDKEWQKYKKEYAKTYTSELDELKHYALYKESQKEVLEHNKLFEAGKVKYTKAINEKSDQKLEEFLALNFGFGFDDK